MAILFTINWICIFIIMFYFGSSSIFFSLILFQTIGFIVCKMLSNKKSIEFNNLLKVFYLSSVTYLVYAIIAYFSYVEKGEFLYPDNNFFYSSSEFLGTLNSLYSIYESCFIDKIHIENEGAHFYFGFLAFIANKYFDGNSVFYQTINVSFFAIFINVFLYSTLRFYLDSKKALYYSIIFLICSYNLSNSPWILRDTHISFLFMLGVYIVHLPLTSLRFLCLLLVQFFVLQFRFETGVAFVGLPIIYIWLKAKENPLKNYYYFIYGFLSIGLIINFLPQIILAFSSVNDTLVRYNEYTSNATEASSGLGVYILSLPFGIKHIVQLFYSQTYPFPFWFYLMDSVSFLDYIRAIISSLPAIIWGYVFYFVIYQYIIKKHRIPKFLIFLFLFAVLFIFANSANSTLRRLLPVYPIIFLVFTYISNQSRSYSRNLFKISYLVIYCLLSVLYLTLKVI